MTLKLLKAAKAGKIDQLLALTSGDEQDGDDEEGGRDANELSYKWLLIAADFGHDTNDELDALLELTPFRYDDEQMIEALIHYEIGAAYLQGEDALPVDLARAKDHLEFAHELKVHVTTDLSKTFAGLRRTLKGEALALFDGIFSAPKGSKAKSKGAVKVKAKSKSKSKAKPKAKPKKKPVSTKR